MNELGIGLSGLAIQVTLAMLPAAALHLFASRRGPVAGSWMAAASLFMIVGLTVLAFLPRPESWGEPATASTESQAHERIILSALPGAGDRKENAEASATSDRFLTLAQARAIWRRLGSRLAHTAAPCMRWAGIAALTALTGTGMGLFRLLLGLWAVHECRRRGKRIDDDDATRLLETLKTAMSCDAAIELRELTDLPTPATAGWRRPMVLLPTDWRAWSESDLRAVFAHELAHIQRADYIVGLMARLALAVHFYHPLVRWMAGRLQSQQELAADAVGARFAGGRGPYLAVLSRMALRQDREISWWPARAFSPARGTLIRRIRMLGDHEELVERSMAAARRLFAAALLAGLTLGAWMLPSPLRGADGEPIATAPGETKPAEPAPKGPPAFDLSYIRVDAMGVFAVHPAAIFRRRGMAQIRDQANSGAVAVLEELGMALNFPISNCPLRVEQIEQFSVAIDFGRTVYQGKELRRYSPRGCMIRTVEPYDWIKLIRSFWPNAVEQHDSNKVYYKVKDQRLGREPSFYSPDDRTLVFDEEPALLRLLRRDAPASPQFAQNDAWKKVERDLFAMVLDNRGGRIRDVTKRTVDLDMDDEFARLLEPTDRWVFGVAHADDFLLRVMATCPDHRSTQTVASLIKGLLDGSLSKLRKPHTDKNPDHLRMRELGIQILNHLRVEAGEKQVTVEASGGVNLPDVLPLLQFGL